MHFSKYYLDTNYQNIGSRSPSIFDNLNENVSISIINVHISKYN